MKEIKSIGSIIQLLQSENFYGISENIEIAKGKNEYITKFKQLKNQFKRKILCPKQ